MHSAMKPDRGSKIVSDPPCRHPDVLLRLLRHDPDALVKQWGSPQGVAHPASGNQVPGGAGGGVVVRRQRVDGSHVNLGECEVRDEESWSEKRARRQV